MAQCRRRFIVGFGLLMVACSAAQDAPRSSSEPAKVRLEVVSTVPVPSLPAQGLALPVLCGDGNTVVTRFAPITSPGDIGDPLAIAPDGQVVARFGREKINDVPQPFPLQPFLAGTDVYILTRAQVPQGYANKWKTPAGKTMEQQAVELRYFVARFKKDGTYVAAVPLDIPFTPLQLGVFDDGNFLIAGVDRAHDPRIAIVSADGQLRRSLEPKGDVHALTEANGPQDKTALPRFPSHDDALGESLMDVLFGSQIVANGPDLLLFRPFGSKVFSVSASGEVEAKVLRVPEKVQIYTVKPTRKSWIVEFTYHEPGEKVEQLEAYAFDPATGDRIAGYVFPSDLGWGLACVDGAEFTVLMADTQANTLKLVKLAPGKPNN